VPAEVDEVQRDRVDKGRLRHSLVIDPFVDCLEVLDDVIDCQLPQAEALMFEAEGDLEPVRDELVHRVQL
jgi:hypothetical protein